MLAAKRMLAHRALFAALFGIVIVITGFSCGIAGYVASAATVGVREGFAAATGSDGSVRAEARFAGDDQDAAVRQIIAANFDGAPLVVERTLESDPVSTNAGELVLGSADVQPRSALEAGAWPRDAGEAVLQADAAASLGLKPGDAITLSPDTTVTISGTWRADDPLDPYWFGEDLTRLLVIDETVWSSLDTTPLARWTVRPDAALVDPGDIDAISAGAASLQEALQDSDDVSTGNVIYGGGLASWTESLRASLSAVAGVAPVPAVLAAVIGLVALVELARLLVGVRVIETGLLRSRGASALRLTRDAAIEAAVAAIPGALLAALVASIVVGVGSWLIPLAVAAVAVLAFAVTTLLNARRPASRDTVQDSGRARRVAGAGLVILVLAAAIVSVWQFRLYGSPVVRGADGRAQVDPIAVLAPALALVALSLLAVVAFGAAAGALDRSTARRGSIGTTLAARQVARRASVFATPVLLIALATGGLVVASTYSATWQQATTTAREVGNGAAVRVVTDDPATGFDSIEGVDAAAPVLTATLQLGDDSVRLIALDSASIDGLMTRAGGVIDTAALAAALSVDVPGVDIPQGTTTLQLAATAPTQLWLADSRGAIVKLTSVGGAVEVPAGSGWRILAVDVRLDATGIDYSYRLDGITADGVALELGSWQLAADSLTLTEGTVTAAADAVGFDARGSVTAVERFDLETFQPTLVDFVRVPAGSVRLVPDRATPELPLAISSALAARGDLAVGDELTLRFEGSGRSLVGTIAQIIAVIPGTSDDLAIAVDLTGFDHQQLMNFEAVPPATEVWIATSTPIAVADRIEGARVSTAQSGPGDALLSAGRVALWIGAGGGLLLAIAAVSAIAGALLRSRTGELVVLRVLGLAAREQAASRRREMLVVIGYSIVAGALSGAIVSALVVPDLARSAVLNLPDALATVLRIDALWAAAGLAALVIALLAVVGLYARRVRDQARTLSAREDVR